jgi:hypothetical protein
MHCCAAACREQATSQMKATRADAQQTQQMMHILQRLHQQAALDPQQQQQHGSRGSSEASSEDDSEVGSEDEEVPAAAAGLDKWLAQSPEFQQLLQRVRTSHQTGCTLNMHEYESACVVVATVMALSQTHITTHAVKCICDYCLAEFLLLPTCSATAVHCCFPHLTTPCLPFSPRRLLHNVMHLKCIPQTSALSWQTGWGHSHCQAG